MNGWLIFLIIALVLGIILSNLLLLKQSAKLEIPADVIKAMKKRKQAEQLQKQQDQDKQDEKKPTEE